MPCLRFCAMPSAAAIILVFIINYNSIITCMTASDEGGCERMLISIVSIIANALFLVMLNVKFYTDRAFMPDGERMVWHLSPLDKLDAVDKRFLWYFQIAIAAVSIISSILFMIGIKNNVVKIVQYVSLAASALMLVIIMIVVALTQAKY